MVIDTHDDPFDSIPKARKDDLILVANCKEQKERWMQKIGDEIRKREKTYPLNIIISLSVILRIYLTQV